MIVEIVFTNWKKYQASGIRYESTSWFRINNNLNRGTLWATLTHPEFRFFLHLLCEISDRSHRSGAMNVDTSQGYRLSNVNPRAIHSCIRKLVELKVIKNTPTVQSLCNHCATLPNLTIRNETREGRILECENKPNPIDTTTKSITPPSKEARGILEELKSLVHKDTLEKFPLITHRIQRKWIEKYRDLKWIAERLDNAADFKDAQEQVPRQGWSAYFSTWLSKDADSAYSSKPSGKSFDDLVNEMDTSEGKKC